MFRSGWTRPEENPGRAYPAGVDFGTVGFIIFVAFWIFIIRARTRAARASRVSGGRRDAMPQPPRPLTIVGIEDRETAVGALAAITGASRSEALARLANLPTTIAVPAATFSAALEDLRRVGGRLRDGYPGNERSLARPDSPRKPQVQGCRAPTSDAPTPSQLRLPVAYQAGRRTLDANRTRLRPPASHQPEGG